MTPTMLIRGLFCFLVCAPGCVGSRPVPRPAPVPEPDPPPTVPPTTTACGRLKLFDSDGDGISNSVEDTNAARRYADLQTGRCDPDPTRPTGTPHSGQLSGALNLPDDGDGYVHFLGSDSADQDDWGSLQTLTCIEQVGRQLRENNLLLNVGDISLRGGGHFPPHASHQNGLDIDLRYIRKDRRSVPLDLRIEPQAYDADATKLVMDAFVKLCPVHIIFVDTDRIQFPIEDTPIFHANGHSNHAHIRLEAPQL